jgi:hypothetical protein
MLINFLSESLIPEANKAEEESLLAAKAAAGYALLGLKAGGDVSWILKPENAGFTMKAALGGTDTVVQNQGGVTGQHQHTIIAQSATAQLPSYTLIIDRKQAIKKYSGCKVSSLKLSGKAGDYIRAVMSVRGKDESTGTITTSTGPTLKSYKFIGATLTVGGTAYEITGFDLEIDNALEDGPQTSISGLYQSEPMHGSRKIKLMIEKPYDANDETLHTTNYLAEAVVATVVLHVESPEIVAVASKYRMDITLANVAILDRKTNVSGRGVLMSSITSEATAVGATEPITAVIYDGNTAAY